MSTGVLSGFRRGRKLFLLGLLLVVGAGAALWEARDLAPTCSLADRLSGASGCAGSFRLNGLRPLPVATMTVPPQRALAIVGIEPDAEGQVVLVRFDGWNGHQVARRALPMDPPPVRMRASPDGSEIALFCAEGVSCTGDGARGLVIRAADGASLRRLEADDVDSFRFEGEPAPDTAGFVAVAVPGTTLVAEADPDSGTVIVRDTGESAAVIRFNPANRFPVDAETFALTPSPGGRFIAAVYADPPSDLDAGALIVVWDIATRRVVAELATDPGHRIEPKIAWSLDETAIFVARDRPDATAIVIERFMLPDRDRPTGLRP